MNDYAYSNFCVEYAFHAIRCQIRPHASVSLRFIGRWFIHMVAHFIVMSNKRCTLIY
jgi:hypothetical protein